MKTYYLAIDIGASSGRHIVGWIEDGKLNLKEVYRFKNGAEEHKGHLFWNASRLFKEVKNGLKEALIQGYMPSYVGIDTWAVDYALLDKDDNIIGDVYCYRDSRTNASIQKVHDICSFDWLYSRTGIQFQPFNTIYQLYEDKLSKRIDGAKSMLMLPDLLNFLLTGVKKQEYTNATSTGMVNATTHEWDGGIISRLGFDKGLFGSLSQPGEQVGFVKDDVAKEIGYKPLVVLPATHDTASAVLAAPLSGQTPYISSGTWSLLGVEQNAVHSDDNSRMVNYSNEGSINFTFRYQKNIMGLWMIQSIKRELNDKYDFAQLSQMARGVQTDYLVNVNDNRFLSPESMIDEVQAAVGQKLDTATLMRVVYNSLAKSYLEAIEELERNTNTQFKTLNIIGGGCRDMLLNELTAQLTKKTIITGPVEATAIGNLIMQMIGVGQLKGIQAARDIIKKSFDINEVRV